MADKREKCATCEADCTAHHFMCDEGCMTQVLSDD